MINVIQDLLNATGRAIIPDIGCLSINDEKQVIFNAFLKFNDGKLSSWLVNHNGIEENDAKQKIATWSREIQETISDNRDFSLGNLGRFYPGKDGEIEFSTENGKQETSQKPIHQENQEPEYQTRVNQKLDNQEIVHVESQNDNDDSDSVAKETEITSIENEKNSDDFPQLKNIYIPSETKTETISNLDSRPLDSYNELSESSTPGHEAHPTEDNTLSNEDKNELGVENIEKNVEKKIEEVTVNRKRNPFFFVNIALLLLIIGLGTFTFIYIDEVSEWLGIGPSKTENLQDSLSQENENEPVEVEQKSSTVPETQNRQEPETSENQTTQGELEQEIVDKNTTKTTEPKTPVESNEIQAVASSGNFHIIVGKFGVKENADRLVQKIRNAGYDGKILRSTSTGHTVSFHCYPTLEDANNNMSKAMEITGTKAYVEKK